MTTYLLRIGAALPFNEVWSGRRRVAVFADPVTEIKFDTPLIIEEGVELRVLLVLQRKHLTLDTIME